MGCLVGLLVLAEVPGLAEGAAAEVADVRSLVGVDQQVLREVRGGVEALPAPELFRGDMERLLRTLDGYTGRFSSQAGEARARKGSLSPPQAWSQRALGLRQALQQKNRGAGWRQGSWSGRMRRGRRLQVPLGRKRGWQRAEGSNSS